MFYKDICITLLDVQLIFSIVTTLLLWCDVMQCNKHVHFTGWNTSFSFNEKSQYFIHIYVISLNTSISIDYWKFYRDGCILYLWRYIMTRWKHILYEDQKLSKTTKSVKQLIIERIIGGMHIIHSLLQYKEEVYNDNLKAHIEWRSTLTRQYNRQLIMFCWVPPLLHYELTGTWANTTSCKTSLASSIFVLFPTPHMCLCLTLLPM